jgi:hypothetical protein
MDAVWAVLPEVRFLQIDPLIHIVPDPERPEEAAAAEGHRLAQYQALDMIAGRLWPQLGGAERYLDIIGLNFYPNNEWIYHGASLRPKHRLYRPLRELLLEVYERYERPLFLSETGTEGRTRGSWLKYVTQEVKAALEWGIPIHGICLYPVVNHPGWLDERHCPNGLWDYADDKGHRPICKALARELHAAQFWLERPALPRSAAGSSDPVPRRRRGAELAAV